MIELKNVSVTFESDDKAVHAVKDVSLSIQSGEIFGVIGYSGAGKSTLVRTINCLQRPSSGQVFVNGQEITALSEKDLRLARKKIGMIFQHFNLMKSRTVAENVAYPLKGSGLSKEESQKKVQHLLDLVGLGNRGDSYPSQLSGGQKQRVAIARALANDPHVLLCDEATSALDPKTTSQILDLLKQVNRELGITIVIITHEMAVIKQICDRVAVMEAGSVVEQDSILNIFSNPHEELTQDFISSASPTEKGIETILANPDLLNIEPGDRLLRIDFTGASTGEPLIASLTKKYDLLANILYANIEILQGTPVGTLLISLNGEPSRVQEAINFVHSSGSHTKEYAFDHIEKGDK
ncbi:methionine ABC transporter ATP-binding protein [Aerococcus sp. Group 1]|uniref:methionine ABC transporter ATP-binding protein n=1 Tax=Aerococcus urinae (strain CCUG 59500 / ACS-120-V-Col10a) TaxID=2976812 RepID=UPI000200EF49|nr:methionine ABC transporter ATP-binding protein [Aerococcus sp. Group 1]AEA00485.1 ABC transporter, ATP-binding protein [Aerococcus sp. Group 1]MCY3030263.1 methionine ABC transporter ATP-binding protein [Aerococcus sp. Group 1]MCY3061969.1 methionine ABC transporter ATP-binding protein [Aerococcus sp. Group 1]